jgi:hypothetical protein
VTVDQLLPLLTGPVAGLAIAIWMIFMQRSDLKQKDKMIEALQRRADAAEVAASTSNALLSKLIDRGVSRRAVDGDELE